MQVRLLGSVDVTVDGVVRPVAGVRRKAVLATLALAAGEVVSINRLISVVWDARAPATAANTLQSHVSYLRRLFGNRTAVVARGTGYALHLGAEATDLLVAERLIRAGKRAAEPSQRAEHLSAALALWRGDPLAEIADLAGLRGQAERLANLRLETVQALAEAQLALGEHASLVPELERITEEHPFHEQLHAQLMIALYRSGRQSEALATYRRLRDLLGRELGLDPGRELRELEAAILRQDLALQPPSPAPTATPPPSAEPPTAPPYPPAELPPAPPPVVPAQLPGTVDGFVGRAAELAHLDSLLAAIGVIGSTPTLIIASIEGTAGVGKTSLAVHWSHRVRDRFPDGQLYLNLRGYATSPPVQPSQALAQFLRALGVADERVPLDVDEAAAMYRSLLADRRMLVLLDNVASAEQVRPLLPGSPHCFVLVTSRDRLGGLVASDGARLLDLDVLETGEAHALLRGVLGEARISEHPRAVAELAELCGYLPLALRIAAANLLARPRVSLERYVTDLREGNRLAGLEVAGEASLAVRAAFDLSYAALKPPGRSMFRLLGLVPGPDIDIRAAAAMAGTDPQQAQGALDQLVDAHLVVALDADRFTVHDLLRHYARSLADAEDGAGGSEAAVQRLVGFYQDATDAAAQLLYLDTVRLPVPPAAPRSHHRAPFSDHTGALAWLDGERANLVALIRAAATHGPKAAAWQLADNLRGYFYLRRYLADHLAVATEAVRAAQGLAMPQAAGHLSLGAAEHASGQIAAAIASYTAALALAEQASWVDGQGAALNNLGTVYSQTGRHQQAAQRLTEAAAVFARTGRLIGQAICVDNLGIVRRELGELAPAGDLHRHAIALHRQTGFPIGHATALTNLAGVCHDLGNWDEAQRLYTEALALHRQTGNRDRQAICLYGMADLRSCVGCHEESLALADEALALARETGDRRTEGNATIILARIDGRLRRFRSALEHSRHALHLAVRTDSRYLHARALVGVAASELGLGHLDEALASAQDALAVIRDGGYRLVEVDALTTLAGLHTALGRPEQAVAASRRARQLRQETGYVPARR